MQTFLTVPFLCLSLTACHGLDAQDPTPPAPPAQAQRLDALRAAGRETPLAVHPVRLLGRPDARTAEVVGLVLEARGMTAVEPLTAPYAPAPGVAWSEVADAFAAHVRAVPPVAGEPRRHHLYAEFLGDPKQGPTEVRFVVVDAAGELVCSDRQTPADAPFQRTAAKDPDPLGCSALVADRLFALAGWRAAAGGAQGRLAERWRQRSGVPDAAARKAMAARLAELRANRAGMRLLVLPTVNADADEAKASAGRMAPLLAQTLGCTATVHAAPPTLAVTPDSNEQARLWQLARGLQAALAKSPADGTHVLVADIGLDPGTGRGFVHAVLCTATGDFVWVEHRNDQHPEFQAAAPRTLQDAERLLVAWAEQRLR